MRLGLTQPQLAELGGVSKGSQILYEKGNAPTADYLRGAAVAGVDILYVLTGTRSAESDRSAILGRISETIARPEEFAQVPVLEASLAAGAGSHNDTEGVIAHLAFQRSWLKKLNISAAAAVIARAKGESMAPTIHDGDIVLIDRGNAEPPKSLRTEGDRRAARIYALLDDGAARIKRLDLAAPDTLAVLSDNPDHPPEFRPISAVKIIGRVMWWGHTNRE